MRIQWSSTAAQETADKLRSAEYALGDCLQRTGLVYSALAEADPDGENKTLQKLSEQFGVCARRLKKLRDGVDDLNRAILKTDERFQEAEARILHLIDAMAQGDDAPAYSAPAAYVNWVPEAFAVMPDMRINTPPLPFWLKRIIEDADPTIY